MKKVFTLFLFGYLLVAQAQHQNHYSICKEVEVNSLTFRKSRGNEYRKSIEKEITQMEFTLVREPQGLRKCILTLHYTVASSNGFQQEEKKQEIAASYFFELIAKLNKIDTSTIREDWNVADGITSSIAISGENFHVQLSDNWKDDKKAAFYTLFDSVWNQFLE